MRFAVQTLLVVLILLINTRILAEDKPAKHALWKWSSDSNSPSTDSGVFKSTSSSLFKGPQLNLPKFPALESAKATTGRAFNSAKNTTSRMWNSTVDFLNPWDNKSSSSSKSKSKMGDAWFFRKKEEPQYSTVNDFLRQERPKF